MQSKSLGLILNAKPIRDNDLYIKIFNVRNSEENLLFTIMNFLGNHCCSYNKIC